jgi:hypothetical protein
LWYYRVVHWRHYLAAASHGTDESGALFRPIRVREVFRVLLPSSRYTAAISVATGV